MTTANSEVATEAAARRIMAARIVAERRWPYMASLLYTLRLVQSDRLDTMAVDSGWRLYYSADFVLAEDVEGLATAMLHEALHCVMAHSERLAAIPDGRPLVWNIAGDLGINFILDGSHMTWTTSVTPVRFSDFETYGVRPEFATEGNYTRLLRVTKKHLNGLTLHDCGSLVDGVARLYELPDDDADAPAVGSAHRATVRDRVASDILGEFKSRGNVPGELLRWAQDYLEPTIDWRRVLGIRLRKAVASVAGRRDYSYMRPSRRQPALTAMGVNAILPAMRQPAPPRVAIVVDTSGSISERELRHFVGEVAGIIRAVGVSQGVWVIACDAQAQPPQRLRSASSAAALNLTGGGGTDMGVGIAAALRIRPTPHVVVVVTDGATPWPTEKPRALEHGIVVLSESHWATDVPSWLTWLVMDPD